MASQPLFVSSGNLVADRRYGWAIDYLKKGDPAAAADILEQVVETAPGFATAWFALAVILEQHGDGGRAVAAFRAASDADPEDYHGARLHLARLGAGEAVPAMTATYVRRLFDQHAPEFDAALLGRLDYRGPEVLLDALKAAGAPQQFESVLDLGCGTGLAGAAIRPFSKRLTGVDISPGMIEQANSKSIYDRLEAAELLDFLGEEGPAQYDLVLAADVFVYCGDLAPIVGAVARVMRPRGLFAFTVETHGAEGILLQPTLRYAHGGDYVRQVLAAASLQVQHLAPAQTRREKGEWVSGLAAVAMAPPSSSA
jgi:predicted TPR repeat methyltransferase